MKCAYSNTGNAVCKVSDSFRRFKNTNINKAASEPLKEFQERRFVTVFVYQVVSKCAVGLRCSRKKVDLRFYVK
jgi:hypothetical protein